MRHNHLLFDKIISRVDSQTGEGEIVVKIKADGEITQNLSKINDSQVESTNFRNVWYPVSDKVSNPFEIRIPIVFQLNSGYRHSLNPDFNQLTDFYPFSVKYVSRMKLAFGINDHNGISAAFGLKKRLDELASTGKYKSIAELAKATGYSDSYVSRVLKYKM